MDCLGLEDISNERRGLGMLSLQKNISRLLDLALLLNLALSILLQSAVGLLL